MRTYTKLLICLGLVVLMGWMNMKVSLAQELPSHIEDYEEIVVPEDGVRPVEVSASEMEIVGGEVVTSGIPSMVAMVTSSGIQFCGGTLLEADVVLTAAHCVRRLFIGDSVRAGVLDLATNQGETRTILAAILHPDYSGKDFDVALVFLSEPFTLSATIATVTLMNPVEIDTLVGDMSTVFGWGYTTEEGNPSDKLLKVDVPIVSMEVCRESYPDDLTARMLCAGFDEGGKDSCQGDSGGPLLLPDDNGNWLQVGIVSFGEGCARPGFYGVYTFLLHREIFDWIYAQEWHFEVPLSQITLRDWDAEYEFSVYLINRTDITGTRDVMFELQFMDILSTSVPLDDLVWTVEVPPQTVARASFVVSPASNARAYGVVRGCIEEDVCDGVYFFLILPFKYIYLPLIQ